MRRSSRALLCLLLPSLAACASAPPTTFVADGYRGRELGDKRMVVIGLRYPELRLGNADDFDDDFKDDPGYRAWRATAIDTQPDGVRAERLRERYLAQLFTDRASAQARMRWPAAQVVTAARPEPGTPGHSGVWRVQQDFVVHYLQVFVPRREALGEAAGGADFALVFDELGFERVEETNPMAATATLPGQPRSLAHANTTRKLRVSLDYVLYDYAANRSAAHGHVVADVPFTFAMTRTDWHTAMQRVLDRVRLPL